MSDLCGQRKPSRNNIKDPTKGGTTLESGCLPEMWYKKIEGVWKMESELKFSLDSREEGVRQNTIILLRKTSNFYGVVKPILY